MISVTRCRLFERTAEELMTRDVVCIPRAMTLRGAAHRLIELDISGAPVTDDQGRCIGVLSRSDLVRFLDKGAAPHTDAYEEFTADWGLACLESLPNTSVADFMTRPVVTARGDATVRELARMMQQAHLHRVVIVGEQGEVVGIVTAMDILGAVAEEEDWPHHA
jgi:CBS domain-containing protein